MFLITENCFFKAPSQKHPWLSGLEKFFFGKLTLLRSRSISRPCRGLDLNSFKITPASGKNFHFFNFFQISARGERCACAEYTRVQFLRITLASSFLVNKDSPLSAADDSSRLQTWNICCVKAIKRYRSTRSSASNLERNDLEFSKREDILLSLSALRSNHPYQS